MDSVPTMSVQVLRGLGIQHEINRLILHPLGLAMYTSTEGDEMGVYDMRRRPHGYYGDDLLSAEKAATVAEMMEARGPARREALGYIIQPLPPEVKQLKVTVLEQHVVVGGSEDLDQGEELELTMAEDDE